MDLKYYCILGIDEFSFTNTTIFSCSSLVVRPCSFCFSDLFLQKQMIFQKAAATHRPYTKLYTSVASLIGRYEYSALAAQV